MRIRIKDLLCLRGFSLGFLAVLDLVFFGSVGISLLPPVSMEMPRKFTREKRARTLGFQGFAKQGIKLQNWSSAPRWCRPQTIGADFQKKIVIKKRKCLTPVFLNYLLKKTFFFRIMNAFNFHIIFYRIFYLNF